MPLDEEQEAEAPACRLGRQDDLAELAAGGEARRRRRSTSSSGNVSATGTRSVAALEQRQDVLLHRAARSSAFSSSGRARSVEARSVAALAHEREEVDLGLEARADADDDDPPARCRAP